MEPKVTGYVKAHTGNIKNATNEKFSNATVCFGGKIEKNGYFAKAETGYGCTIYGQAELGKEFEIANNTVFTTSVGGSYTKSEYKTDYYKERYKDGDNGPEWKPFDARGYANASVNFKGKWGEVGVGVQGGVKHSKKPELPPEGLDQSIGITRGTDVTGSRTKAYVTPTVNSKINLGRGFSLNFDAALDKGSLGVAWNF